MDNRQLIFILKMRDEATKVYNDFKSNVKKGMDDIKNSLGGFKSILAGAFSVAALKSFITESNTAERAGNALGQALKNQGVTSQKVKDDMLAYSSALQKQTTFGDDAITSVQTMLVSMTGLTGEAIKPLTKATLDLATGMNMDVESAGMLIAKTLAGQDALGRYGISVKGATTESEKLAAILEGVAQKFGGRAAAEAQTTAGRMKQLAEQVSDLKEKFGDLIKQVLEPLIPILGGVVKTMQALPAPVSAAILVVGGLTVAILGLNAALLTNPITWIILGIAGAVTALGVALSTTTPEIKNLEMSLDDATPKMIEYKKAVADSNSIHLDFAKNFVKPIENINQMNAAVKLGGKTYSEYKKEIEEASQALEKMVPGTKEFEKQVGLIKELTDKFKNYTEASDIAAARIKKNMEEINKAIKEMTPRGGIFISDADEKDFEDKVKNAEKQIRHLSHITGKNHQVALEEIGAQKGVAVQAIAEVQASFTTFHDIIAVEGLAVWQNIGFTAMNTAQTMKYAFEDFANGMVNVIWGGSLQVKTIITNLAKDVTRMLIQELFVKTAVKGVFGMLGLPVGLLFHEGGVVPKAHGGAYINAPANKEFPILVRGGETIRTEKQEAALKGGNTVVININSPVPHGEWVKKSVEDGIRATGLSVDKYFVNNRNAVTL